MAKLSSASARRLLTKPQMHPSSLSPAVDCTPPSQEDGHNQSILVACSSVLPREQLDAGYRVLYRMHMARNSGFIVLVKISKTHTIHIQIPTQNPCSSGIQHIAKS